MATYSGTCPNCGPHEICGHCMSYRRQIPEKQQNVAKAEQPSCPTCGTDNKVCNHCETYRMVKLS